MHNRRAFTLLELLVVCIVIGILVTLAIPNYARSVERAKCSTALNTLKQMRNAALAFFAENDGTFSPGGTDMTIADLETTAGASFASNADWVYTMPGAAVTATTFTITATRQRGPHTPDNTVITLDQDENWSNPATAGNYPWDNPGIW